MIMGDKELEIRPYRSGDEDDIVELLVAAFDGWPHFDTKHKPIDYWRWKYYDNPQGKMAIGVADHEGEIVGCNHNVQQRAKIGEEVYLFAYGADAAVNPEHRGKGIYSSTWDMGAELQELQGGLPSFVVSSNPILIQRNIRNKRPRISQDINIYVKIKDVDLHIEMMPPENPQLKKYGYLALEKLSKATTRRSGTKKSLEDMEIENLRWFNERYDVFWNQVKSSYDFIVERTPSHLNWRYCDSRAGSFEIIQATRDEVVIGYIVMRINRFQQEYPVGYIMDFITLPGRDDVAEHLLNYAEKYFEDNNVNVVTGLAVKNSETMKTLHMHGYLDSRESINIFSWAPQIKKLDRNSKIFFSLGDFDHI